MSKTKLTKSDLENGRRLIEGLDSANFNVTSAFWFYDDDVKLWRLIIVSNIVEQSGTNVAFNLLSYLTSKDIKSEISLTDITILGTNSPLNQIVSTLISTGNSISEIRLTDNTVNGVVLKDLYLYRSNR